MDICIKVFTACIAYFLSLCFGSEPANSLELPASPAAYYEEAPAPVDCCAVESGEEYFIISNETVETASDTDSFEKPALSYTGEIFTTPAAIEQNIEFTPSYTGESVIAFETVGNQDIHFEEVTEYPTALFTEEPVIEFETVSTPEFQSDESATDFEQLVQSAPATEEITFIPEETISVEQIVNEEIAWRGNYGRLYISDVGVDVAVFFTQDLYNLQYIVDADDSACMFNWYDGNTMIADHNYQGFESIKHCVPGTCAELVTANGTSSYTLQEIIYNGWNTGSSITYNDGTPISVNYTGSLVMYTCNGDGTITITIWQ